MNPRSKPPKSKPSAAVSSATVPETKPVPTREEIISNIRKMLLAKPDFSRLYADVLISEGLNPSLAKNLAETYQKKFGAPMTTTATRICTHIKTNGIRCGSPSLRGEQFCYFHQRMIRGVRTPPKSRIHPIANLEDDEAIQTSLMEVVDAIVRNHIDIRRAELMIRALNTAVRNIRRARFHTGTSEMVRDIPDYAAPSDPLAALPPRIPPAPAEAHSAAKSAGRK
jgi:hypothetical protein